jgi:cytoskeletal protein CcmA (bactofilin family)
MFTRKEEAPEVQTTTTPASSLDAMTSPASRISTPIAQPPRASQHQTRRLDSKPSEERRLTVGKGLSLSGEISACDSLIVEGKVDAKLSEGKLLEITESGQFRGTVEIENADIAGRYDGQLTVHGRLTIRSTGRISGMVCYGELEINAGGQIIGELQVVGEGKPAAAAPSGKGFKNAAKFTSLIEDEEDRRVVVSA